MGIISKLVSNISEAFLSPNHYWGRKGFKVDTITVHYVAGNCTIESLAAIFRPVSRQASSNYGIGSDGRIACFVYEENAAWTSGSWRNDCRAITIEVSNLWDSSVTNAAWKSLVELCVDICRRYGFKGVQYTGNADHSQQKSGYMLFTKHKWFQSTDCPGRWLDKQFERLASEVNAKLSNGKTPESIKPCNNVLGGKLDVDGIGGYNTVLDLQHMLGTYEDGVISGQWVYNRKYFTGMTSVEWGAQGSQMVKALQEKVGAIPDGIWGQETSTKLQEWLVNKGYDIGEYGIDGYFGHDSVCALQRSINDGKWK